MKGLRNIKLRTFCPDPVDLILGKNHNPLKEEVSIPPTHEMTVRLLANLKKPVSETGSVPQLSHVPNQLLI